MKIQNKAILLAVLAVGVLSTIAPSAFAQSVSIPSGTSVPGCEDDNACWDPSEISVDVGATVTWTNDDAGAHTVTAGDLNADANNVGVKAPGGFDSGMLMSGATFPYQFDEEGSYPYFCMIHPWMIGTVIVGGAMAEEDVELMVTITESRMGEGTHVYLEFSEIQVNYEMIGMQNDEEIFTIPGHAMEMTSDHHIDAVGTPESPLDIKIVSLGIGPSDAEDDWTSATITDGDTIQVIPEFGAIAMMVLGVSIVSIIALSAKSRVILKL